MLENKYRVIYYTGGRWALYTIKSIDYCKAQETAIEFMLTNEDKHAIVIHDSFCNVLEHFPSPEEMRIH